MKLTFITLAITCMIGTVHISAQGIHKSVTVGQGTPLSAQISADERFKISSLEIKSDNDKTFTSDDEKYLTDWLGNDSCIVEELSMPWMDMALTGNQLATKSVKKITYDFMSVMNGQSFNGCPNLEEVIFNGAIGHIDGYVFNDCPKLKRIVFNGPVFDTGGEQFVRNCPELETIEFNGIFYYNGLGAAVDCPKFKGYDVRGIVVRSVTDAVKTTPGEEYKQFGHLVPQVEQSLFWIDRVAFCNSDWHQQIAIRQTNNAKSIARAIGRNDIANKLDSVYYMRLKNRKSSYLELLKSSKQYSMDFKYAPASDSLLTRTREYFNLDSVAGNGDDVSKIKNLLYWVHDLVRHDGSSSWPECKFNLPDLYEVAKKEDRGYNCRFLAMMLTEALLAEGIPARYLTCQSAAYNLDNDCHVITVAWSDSLGKWVWVDPSFAAFVTDENGLMLHPGEVRERLIDGRPLVLNEDANWNHKEQQTKEGYLENYMAKNLYIMSANTINQSEPEGQSDHRQGNSITLVPEGFSYNGFSTTTDPDYFWQSPR